MGTGARGLLWVLENEWLLGFWFSILEMLLFLEMKESSRDW